MSRGRRLPIPENVARLRSEAGFGLVELLIALTVLNIGLLATVAAFGAGAFAIDRADRVATATTIADGQMEVYRALSYDWIGLDSTATTDATYTGDAAYAACPAGATCAPATQAGCPAAAAPLSNACAPIRTLDGPDQRGYRVDSFVSVVTTTSGAKRPYKRVVIVVRNADTLAELAREESVFDCSTGADGSVCA